MDCHKDTAERRLLPFNRRAYGPPCFHRLQGGIHRDYDGHTYLSIVRAARECFDVKRMQHIENAAG